MKLIALDREGHGFSRADYSLRPLGL